MNEGILLINKPKGISSFGVVKKIRYLSKVKKVGHAGTLDPIAKGLLILALGKPFTKHLSLFQDLKKTYYFSVKFGEQTDTLDSEGVITKQQFDIPSNQEIQKSILNILPKFMGVISQIPPNFSAKKINGKRAYKLAREGAEFEIPAKKVEIEKLELISVESEQPIFNFCVTCSKGTYVRSLARDFGDLLEIPSYCTEIYRSAIGDYKCDDALDFDTITENDIEKSLIRLLPKYEDKPCLN